MCWTIPVMLAAVGTAASSTATWAAGVSASSWLSAAGLATSAAGLTMNAIGSYNQGVAAEKQSDYAAMMQENNAEIANMQADNAITRGNMAIAEQRLQVNRAIGTGRANYAAGNIVLGKGSALDWEEDFNVQAEYDRRKIGYNSQLEVWGYKNQAGQYGASANATRMAGENAKDASYMNMFGSLVSGVGNTAFQFGSLANKTASTPEPVYKVGKAGWAVNYAPTYNTYQNTGYMQS